MSNQASSKHLRKINAQIENNRYELRATQHSCVEDYYNESTHTHHIYTFGITNATFWNPATRGFEPLSPNNPDKFLVSSPNSLSEARQEFFNRLYAYLAKRFNRYVYITITIPSTSY